MYEGTGTVRLYESLVRFNSRIADVSHLDDVFATLDDVVRSTIRDVSGVSMWLKDPEHGGAQLSGFSGVAERELSGFAASEAFQELMSLREIRTEQIREDAGLTAAELRPQSGIVSWMAVPLRSCGRTTGFILLSSAQPTFDLSQTERDTLIGIAAHTATIIERNHLEDRLRHASLLLIKAQESERRAISQDVHDEIGGSLNSLRLMLKMMRPGDSDSERELEESIEVLDEVIAHLRDLSFRLSPRMLTDLGLVATARSFVKRFSDRTRIQVSLHNELDLDARYRSETESTAFRVIQESLTNVGKHSKAQSAEVHLREADTSLIVHVIDNGVGFEVGSLDAGISGIGIRGLRERVALVGGHLEISSSPGDGTRISAVLPT